MECFVCDDKKTLKLKKKNLKKQKVLLGLGVQREMVFGGGYRKEEKKNHCRELH